MTLCWRRVLSRESLAIRTLLLDVETAPNRAWVWGLWDQNISLSQLEVSSYILCWSAKWLGEKNLQFRSIRYPGGELRMLRDVHGLLDLADVVIHYNGMKFDIPVLGKEFVKHKLGPPSPYKQVDLMRVCKRAFRFESNKLAYVAQALGLVAKVPNEGFSLWVKCMAGDPKAWKQMEKYNRGDVILLEQLYKRLLPWIEKHPSHSAFKDVPCCPKCGSDTLQSRGTVLTSTLRYPRYRCQACAGWSRGTKTVSPKGERRVNI